MSMILDALTRAEHERQLEQQPDLKFVTPVKPKKPKLNNLWLWIGLGVLVNILILFFIVRALTGGEEPSVEMAANVNNATAAAQENPERYIEANDLQPQIEVNQNNATVETIPATQIPKQTVSTEQQLPDRIEATPLAMEVDLDVSAELDRPLLYESKQPNSKPKAQPKLASVTTQQAGSKNKGQVSFSSTELTADDAIPVISKPKLLIDQGNNAESTVSSSTNVPSVRDLPESSRASLNQYEVNVHVFDDDPIRRFVLINMDKYKEGDRIANNGPLVQEITVDGVVVDYGSGRALLPPK